MSSLPEIVEYDAEKLRRELTELGFSPGPITFTTKRVYIRKLFQLKKQSRFNPYDIHQPTNSEMRVYSPELEKTLKHLNWTDDLSVYKKLEDTVINEFTNPSATRKWREGIIKSSFSYLLLDPRKIDNLPRKADRIPQQETWRLFLSSIFYVGKGKKSRPYKHLYEAVTLWRQGSQTTSTTRKIQTILDIWNAKSGVICLSVFHNVIPVEAYTREAAMITALKLQNVSNERCGDFYGLASTWSMKQKQMLGTYLLYKAMNIFLNEGERQLFPNDINTA